MLRNKGDDGEEDRTMQTLTIEAVTPESGRALYDALAAFEPEWDCDAERRWCFLSARFSPVQQRGARDESAWNDPRTLLSEASRV